MLHERPSSRRRRSSLARGMALAFAALLLGGGAIAQPRIVSPAADETVHSNSGDVRVVVAGVPPRRLIQPVLDGVAVSAPVEPPELELHGVVRGEHELVVKIVGADGSEVGRIGPVRFHVFHASRLERPQPR